MKKYFFILILFLIFIVSVSAKSINNTNLNSNDLLDYLKEQNINDKVIKVCNIDYCDYLKYDNLEKSVNKYIEDYLNYIKEKTDEDTSLRVSLKGFLITEVIYS